MDDQDVEKRLERRPGVGWLASGGTVRPWIGIDGGMHQQPLLQIGAVRGARNAPVCLGSAIDGMTNLSRDATRPLKGHDGA